MFYPLALLRFALLVAEKTGVFISKSRALLRGALPRTLPSTATARGIDPSCALIGRPAAAVGADWLMGLSFARTSQGEARRMWRWNEK